MNKYKKLYTATMKNLNNGKIPKPLTTIQQVNCMKYLFNNLQATKTPQLTIQSEIANFFFKFGFDVSMDINKTNYIIKP